MPLPGSFLVFQDSFFLPVDSQQHTLIPALNHFNWEIMTSLDMEKMHALTENCLFSNKIKMADGCGDKQISGVHILIFNDEKLGDLCHCKYFLTLTRKQCRGRRRKKMLDDLGDRRGYCHLKEKALDCIKWRNCFGRDCGPVI
ncbi:hypothetical protein B7P43_G16836 [Cryptotermes secundus]|uniref:Uncharacterized protein n=1 Tax=Cryptotermes secundus TaxID=105785 RepID=A0A2J7QE36_9NEOP|nr:hypothetical protein B7P43_G16836 [Cryptotermes secundus]